MLPDTIAALSTAGTNDRHLRYVRCEASGEAARARIRFAREPAESGFATHRQLPITLGYVVPRRRDPISVDRRTVASDAVALERRVTYRPFRFCRQIKLSMDASGAHSRRRRLHQPRQAGQPCDDAAAGQPSGNADHADKQFPGCRNLAAQIVRP